MSASSVSDPGAVVNETVGVLGSNPYDFIISCEQVFSRKSVGYVWSKRNELDAGQVAIVKSLYDNRRKGKIDGSHRADYKLARSGAGRLGYGRLYGTRGSFETLEREIRGTVCKEFYYDIDIKNAHPVLLHQLAKTVYNIDMPEVKMYCDNRDAYLKQMKDNNGQPLSRDDAKSAILKIMYGGKNTCDFLREFGKEVETFVRLTLGADAKHSKLLAYVRKQEGDCGQSIGSGAKEYKIKNIWGTFLALILQTEEVKCMLAMRKSLTEQEWSVDVLAYDGVCIRRQPKRELSENMLRQTEKDVLADTGYVVELADKEFECFEIPVDLKTEIAPKISSDEYQEKKVQFETSHFYFAPANTIAEVNEKGQLAFYSLDHAATLYKPFDFIHSTHDINDRTSFLKLWLNDATKRTHWEIDQKPSDDPRIYSPPVVFAHERATADDDDTVLSFFRELVALAAGGDHDMEVYMLYWFAHILQKPFENPGTSIILTGKQGCGKDTLGDFISEWLIGRSYSHNYTSTEQFWDKHDCERMGKFFIKIEEASGFLNRQHLGQMKAIITSHTLTVNPKGTKALTTSNYNRIFMTTNEGSPVKLEEGNRRFVISACSPKRVGDHAYWKALRAALFNKEGAAIVAKFLMNCKLDNYDPQVVPTSAYAKEVMENDMSVEYQFLQQWDGVELTATAFFRTYCDYCNNNELAHATTSTALAYKMLTAIRDGKLQKTRKADAVYYSKPQASSPE
jgi:hypothetical protein